MLLRLWAFLTGGRVVWLLDFDGQQTRTVARPGGFGVWTARRMSSLDRVSLFPDGRVGGLSYVTRWEFESRQPEVSP